MAELSFASMKKLLEDNWGDGYYDKISQIIINANSNNTILQYGQMIGNMNNAGDEKEALEFGERAIKNRIPFVMIAFSITGMLVIESIQISEFKWINEGDSVLLQTWDVDTEPSGLLEDNTVWTGR